MRIKKRNKWKTAFKIRYGYFVYQVILFELINTLAIFQDYINKILAETLDVYVIIYLDDIFIYTKSKGKEHIQAIQWVLDQLRKHLLYTNLKKCQFYQDEMRFLGYIVSFQGIQIEKEKIKAVYDWLELQSICDILVFLRFANFYQQFIQRFNRLAASLTSILKTTLVTDSANENLKQSD